MKKTFFLRKMSHSGAPALEYFLGDIKISDHVGQPVTLSFTGRIECVHCGRKIKKTFNQGFCYPCFIKLAECDSCIMKPELCHFRQGTCREPLWAMEHCLIRHVVYLSNTSGLKVGITREPKKMERWGDQGAIGAIMLAVVPERYFAGLIEIALKAAVKDRTDWRALVRGIDTVVDLKSEKQRLSKEVAAEFRKYIAEGGENDTVYEFRYPVEKYPEKAVVHNPEKDPKISGRLEGIRGQYLFIAGKALNIRKYGGFELELEL